MCKLIIISGNKQSGKTSYLINLWHQLNAEGIICAGFLAEGTFKNNRRNSFKLIDISTKDEMLLMDTDPDTGSEIIGRFYINEEGLKFGKNILNAALISDCKKVFIDEIGPLELENKGWSGHFKQLLDSKKELIISVRFELLQEVISYFKLNDYQIILI